MPKIDALEVSIFIFFFVLITVIGFVAARWRRGNLNSIHEWGLAGRRFGTIVTWFLLGGDLYTAYTFIAVPGAVFTQGAVGFFAVPYTVLIYPLIFILMPKFWTVCKQRGYVTAADFVKDRFGSSSLALAVASPSTSSSGASRSTSRCWLRLSSWPLTRTPADYAHRR
jgi:solute:Na+ symporter, SSS family